MWSTEWRVERGGGFTAWGGAAFFRGLLGESLCRSVVKQRVDQGATHLCRWCSDTMALTRARSSSLRLVVCFRVALRCILPASCVLRRFVCCAQRPRTRSGLGHRRSPAQTLAVFPNGRPRWGRRGRETALRTCWRPLQHDQRFGRRLQHHPGDREARPFAPDHLPCVVPALVLPTDVAAQQPRRHRRGEAAAAEERRCRRRTTAEWSRFATSSTPSASHPPRKTHRGSS